MNDRGERVSAGERAVRMPLMQSGNLGIVVPVLAASPGAGATTVAAALADAAQIRGCAVLLVDTADGARSGLARAARTEGPARPGPRPGSRMRYSWRAQALLARAETTSATLNAADLPPPPYWLPPGHRVRATVVDLASDPWSIATNPAAGAGAWLAPVGGGTHPIVVVRPSLPGVIHAEQILARLEYWGRRGSVALPCRLVVVGVRKWPAQVAASAGARVQALIPTTVFLPHDSGLAVEGVTASVTPPGLRDPLKGLLDQILGPSPGGPVETTETRDRSRWRIRRARLDAGEPTPS
ncbi:hypothetical protein [Amycolatopsis sp. NBC_01480]|uniref:hypothetical protein n=1 Tax=Amycolatopsis sp. NBC_01480 TaxID=2903562 RepID=UPI002E2A4F97|nr:hypothetical protein [Amycolatopsis sp. NBC_01480]